MITKSLLNKIKIKNPNYSTDEIKFIIIKHLSTFNRKLSNCQSLSLKIPKLGTIHTHGNVKNKRIEQQKKASLKCNEKIRSYSKETLLF